MLSFIFLILFINCSNRQGNDTTHMQGEGLLNHIPVCAEGDFIGFPDGMIFLNDSTIIGIDFLNQHSMYCYTLGSNKIISFGEKGQGPDEFTYIASIQRDSDSSFLCYESMTRRYTRVSLTRRGDSVFNKNKSLPLSEEHMLFKVVRNKNISICLGPYENCMLKVYDSSGVSQGKYYEYPFRDKTEKGISNRLRAMAYQGLFKANPSETKFVYASLKADIIHFFETNENGGIDRIKRIEHNYPQYKPINENGTISAGILPESIETYVDLFCTDEFVYLLYSGKTYAYLKSNDFNDKNKSTLLCVYNWSGEKIKYWNLDIPCSTICVDKKNKTMWAVAKDPDPTLVRFDLPDF